MKFKANNFPMNYTLFCLEKKKKIPRNGKEWKLMTMLFQKIQAIMHRVFFKLIIKMLWLSFISIIFIFRITFWIFHTGSLSKVLEEVILSA